jgi:Xaa-Pro aminopeptidase
MDQQEYIHRRKVLREQVGIGSILFPGNNYMPMNYFSNPLPFRQDSNFLYYIGIDAPGLVCVIDCDTGDEILFGIEPTTDDILWSGPLIGLNEMADYSGIKKTAPLLSIEKIMNKILNKGQKVHYLPPYTADRKIFLSNLLKEPINRIEKGASIPFIKAVISQRSIKSNAEIVQIEEALNNTTGNMHIETMKMALPGVFEYEIVAEMYRLAKKNNVGFAYPVICSVHGEILHNEKHLNQIKSGQLLLVDAGAESRKHYASDITRTIPVGRRFSSKQKEIYEIVLSTQLHIIENIKPGEEYINLHALAAHKITKGLKNLGLMKGDTDEAVNAGAHALFFPHGLGHMLGLDVHDMEDLGEDYVGYEKKVKRSNQFGTANLRMAKALEPGYVVTVEPGIYFIPALINTWQREKKFHQFINYSKLEEYRNFGGIRIEDNILVTNIGGRVLGNPIPKLITEIETMF